MQLLSVNVGSAQPVNNKTGITGIYKLPVQTAVITSDGLEGDAVCDTKNHGGIDQAVYIYGSEDYAWWKTELGKALKTALVPGVFGENLTLSDLESANYSVGDRFYIGSGTGDQVVLEVTAPRIPCGTFALRMGDPTFVKRFRRAERPGLYCRVIQPGRVRVGDRVAVARYVNYNGGETITILEMFRDFYSPKLDEATLRRHLAAPIAIRDRESRSAELAQLTAS